MAVGDLTRIKVAPTLFSGDLATLYTIPASRKVVHIEMNLLNMDATTEYMATVEFIPFGGSASDTNTIIKQVTAKTGLQPGELRQYTFNEFLGAGDFIQGKGSTASKITCHMSLVLEEV